MLKPVLSPFIGVAIWFGALSTNVVRAAEPTLAPVPDLPALNDQTPTPSQPPVYHPPIIGNQLPIADQTGVPQAACIRATMADIYTVRDLTECGCRIDNSGVRGVFNRHHCCASEKVVAEVLAAPCTCDDCGSKLRARQIRCERGDYCLCENEDYVRGLITNLMDNSRRVRRQSVVGLRRCGYRVERTKGCVETEVPSLILY